MRESGHYQSLTPQWPISEQIFLSRLGRRALQCEGEVRVLARRHCSLGQS